MKSMRAWKKLVVPLAVTALFAAACSDDSGDTADTGATATDVASTEGADDSETTDPAATDPPATDPPETDPPATDPPATDPPETDPPTTEAADDSAAALGEPDPATGDPIRIGLLTNKGSESLEAQGQLTLDGAEIAVQYVNDFLGGLGGSPIELFDCGIGATPELATDCANQMVEQGVAGVILPFAGNGDVMVPIITGAGIAYVTGSGSSSQELTAPGAFALSGGYLGTLGAFAQHAAAAGIPNVTHIVIDVPAAVGAAQAVGGPLFETAGVGYEVITAAPGTPDLTPQVQAASGSVMVTGDVSFCTSFLQAYSTLALDLPKYLIGTCIDESVAETVPGAYEGAFLATGATETSPDLEIYGAMLETYAPDDDINPNPVISGGIAAGVGIVMNFSRAMDGLTDHTAAGVLEKMASAADVPSFLSDGFTFTCDGSALPLTPNVCTVQTYISVLDADGVPLTADPVDPTDLFGQAFGG